MKGTSMEGDTNSNDDNGGDNNGGDTFNAEDEVNYTDDDHFCANYDDNVGRGQGGL